MPSGRRYLEGHFAPLIEEVADFNLTWEGTLPAALTGAYLRAGPNPLPDTDPQRYHWVAGTGMVHGVELASGRALGYRNRWLLTPEVQQWRGQEIDVPQELMVPPGSGNGGLIGHARRLYATSEMAPPYELTRNLETVGLADFGAAMPAGSVPHPRHDPVSGDLHTLAYHFEAPYLRHHRIDPRGQLVETREIPLPRPIMVHDFALTDDHLVIFDLPVVFSEDALLDGQPLPYRWQADGAARVGLIPRQGDVRDSQWFDMPACWVTHIAGARQQPGEVVVDVIQQPARFHEDLRGEDEGPRKLMRYTLDTRRGVALPECLDEDSQDLPQRDPRLPYGDNRWLWTTAMDQEDNGQRLPAGSGLYRHDLEGGERRRVRIPEGWLVGEMSFVAAHPRVLEGRGWLVGFIHDMRRPASELLVLDAAEPDAEPVARIQLPQRIPFGNHGLWVTA